MRGRRMEKQEISDDDDRNIAEYEGEKQQGWMMDAAKKVIMAGIVISSAPLLLPPFLVVSALGFALALPSGVVLASYACTRKLMTKLLPPPLPLSPPLLPYHDEEEEEEICYPRYNDDDVQVGVERELEKERKMSSSSSSSSSENENMEEIQISSDLVLKNEVDEGKTAAGGVAEEEPKKEGDQLKEEKAKEPKKEGDQLKEEKAKEPKKVKEEKAKEGGD